MEYRYALSGNTKIYYQERGSGDPLVLIMGFGADGSVWEKHALIYEKDFRCILIDNRGIGRSGQPKGPYTTLMMAGDVIAVMDHAGIQQARIAGISMGGTIAQELAINYPHRVKSLALISTWGKFNNYAKAVYENLKHVRVHLPGEEFMELLQLWIFAPPYYKNNWDELKNAAGINKNIQTRDGFEGQLDACIGHDAVNRLEQINIPVLITVGGMDIFTPPAFSDVLHNHIRGSRLSVYPEGGHVHHWEDLERFNTETLHFFLKN
jgi:pimeloyl-ACP methyl ester carboxylesterase